MLRIMVTVSVRKLWLGASVAAVAAVVATGAFGVSGSDAISTIAGSGKQGFSGDGGLATSAQLRSADGVAVDKQGSVYIADTENARVRKVSSSGIITTFAGTGTAGSSGDGGLATSARFNGPRWVAVDVQGNVYISDFFNSRVRKVNTGGTVSAFAGTGIPGSSGDGGSATSARLLGPQGVAVDQQGNVYIADGNSNRLRKVSPDGTITTLAGTGVRGSSGDGGPAEAAQLAVPYGVAVDAQRNVYIAESGGNRVRKVSPGGTITTFAGGGSSTGDGGKATSAQLRNPHGVAVDGQGNVYISEFPSHRVRKVSPGGTITTLAGTNAGGGFSGDGGAAASAQVFGPWGVAVDGQGNVYIGDHQNYRVRKVTAGTEVAAPVLTLGGAASQPLLVQQAITVTARADRSCTLAVSAKLTILGTRYVFTLTPASARLAVAGSRTLTLRIPASALKRFRLLWKPGLKARVTITVRATDKAGRTSTSKRIVAVRR